MTALTNNYQRKLQSMLSDPSSDDKVKAALENQILQNSILKLVLEKIPRKVDSQVDPFKVSRTLFIDSLQTDSIPNENQIKAQTKHIAQVQHLLQRSKEAEETEPTQCANLFDDFHLLEWANVALPKSDIFKLNLSMQQLAASLPVETGPLRFFGLISTRSKPYYVVKGLTTKDDEVDESNTQELVAREGRNGVNKYTYWVTQGSCVQPSEWIELPPVTCGQICQARVMKRLLTGNLDAPVPSYPPFQGTEKNFLRAVLADIDASTSISPDGMYEVDEGDDTGNHSKRCDTYASKPVSELLTADAWKHHELVPNALGRVLPMPESTEEGKEGTTADETAEVPPPTPLSAVVPDEWTFRSFISDKSLVVARSRTWPGAVTVVSGTRCVSAYFGNAVKFSHRLFQPALPPPIQTGYDMSGEGALVEQPDITEDPALALAQSEAAADDGTETLDNEQTEVDQAEDGAAIEE